MKTRFLALLLLVAFGTHINSASSGCGAIRPGYVQADVDASFARIKNNSYPPYAFKGKEGFYKLMAIDEKKVIRDIVARVEADESYFQADGKKHIYLMDIGAGQGYWAGLVGQFVKAEYGHRRDLHFHIASITGGPEFARLRAKVVTEHNYTWYFFDQFKMENIREELELRGFGGIGKIDFAVSRFTLQYCIDPWGTLSQIYDLLRKDTGLFMASGFIKEGRFNGEAAGSANLLSFWDHLSHSSEGIVFRQLPFSVDYSETKHSEFMLKRTQEHLDCRVAYLLAEEAAVKGTWYSLPLLDYVSAPRDFQLADHSTLNRGLFYGTASSGALFSECDAKDFFITDEKKINVDSGTLSVTRI